MKIEANDPNTGRKFSANADDLNEESLLSFLEFEFSDEDLKRKIDSLALSADLKSLLYSISSTTLRAGRAIIKIGKKVLEVVFTIMNDFPKASGLMVLGGILGVLISSIPLFGAVLGPFVVPLLGGLGLVVGSLEDIKDATLKRKIVKTVGEFESLRTVKF